MQKKYLEMKKKNLLMASDSHRGVNEIFAFFGGGGILSDVSWKAIGSDFKVQAFQEFE